MTLNIRSFPIWRVFFTFVRINHKFMSRFRFLLFFLLLQAGFQTTGQPLFKAEISDSIDVLHYGIALNMVNLSTKSIAGTTDLTITPRVSAVSSFRLWLQSLSLDSVKINGTPAASLSYNDTLMCIGLSSAINPGDTIKVKIYYHGKPVTDPSDWGGFYFSADSSAAFNLGVGFASVPHNYGRVWFPCIDDFVDRATYDTYITTKTDKMAVCGGSLIEAMDNGDSTKTWHWRLNNPVPTYLASVAVGNYVAVADTFHGMSRDIPTFLYVRPADTSRARSSFINLNQILSVLESRFGPYAWERVGYVGVAFGSGAMEHVTNIAYPNLCFDGTLNYQDLYTHELSHMWFGNYVTCATAEDMWINEGWARYCEAIAIEGLYGRAAYDAYMNDLHKNAVQFLHVEDNGYRAIYGIPPAYTYCSTVYDKGGDVAHTLRGTLGDSLFFPALKNLFNDYSYQHISSTELRDYLSAQTGVDLTAFFDAWVFAPGFPHFSIDSMKVSGNGPYDVHIYLRQKLDNAPAFANQNVLEVTFMNDQWQSHTDTVHFSGETQMKTISLPFAPSVALLDPGNKISDAITAYSSVIKGNGAIDMTNTYCTLDVKAITDSALVRIEHNFVAPDPLKSPNSLIKRLSNYRYWKVDGIFPPGFVTRAKFRYTRSLSTSNGYLDNVLLSSPYSKDSLLLLYRRGPAEDWQIVPFTIVGTITTGTIEVDTLRKGEYTLAIGNSVHYGVPQYRGGEPGGMKAFPNPSDKDFTLEWEAPEASLLRVFDLQGSLTQELFIEKNLQRMTWKPGNIREGTYVLKLYNAHNALIGQDKVIYLP